MNAGFSFQETLAVSGTEKNRPVYEKIRAFLEEGQSAADFLPAFCPDEIRPYLSGFLMYMDLAAALGTACEIVREEKKQRLELIRGCLYPCLLLTGMTAGIFLFALFVLPSMLSLMRSLNLPGAAGFERTGIFIRVFSALTAVCTAAGSLFAIWRLQPERITATYRWLCVRFPDSWLVMSASRDFCRFFLQCMRRGVSTYQALHMLRKIQSKPLVAFIAGQLDDCLMSGESFEKAMSSPYVETALSRFIHLAAAAGNCESMLEGYLAMSAKRTDAAVRRFSRIVQLFSYTLIGAVLIFVYSILMMPMTMLQMI